MNSGIISHVLLGLALCAGAPAAARETRNVVLITLDGLRWQEVFRGLDADYLHAEHGGVDAGTAARIRSGFDGATAAARRARLMPFLWGEVATRGQLIGNRDLGSRMRVSNDQWFSYPGYNEILAGAADPAIKSNDPVPNRNVTVLEWLHGRPGFAGRVVACTTWQAFTGILNIERAGFPLWSTGRVSRLVPTSPAVAEIERWMDDIPPDSDGEHWDAFTYRVALEVIDSHRPRVLYLSFGETDTMAHQRHYDLYLQSAQRADRFIRTIWEKLQSLPEYRASTTLVITTDHGRGATPKDWTDHERKVPRSDETWMAVLGPDTAPLGERSGGPEVISAQVAATVAALLGEDFVAAFPQAAPPVAGVLPALN